ncbi:unnamed protein product [Diplocarpon coronariae]
MCRLLHLLQHLATGEPRPALSQARIGPKIRREATPPPRRPPTHQPTMAEHRKGHRQPKAPPAKGTASQRHRQLKALPAKGTASQRHCQLKALLAKGTASQRHR